jgi:hypothetical protein
MARPSSSFLLPCLQWLVPPAEQEISQQYRDIVIPEQTFKLSTEVIHPIQDAPPRAAPHLSLLSSLWPPPKSNTPQEKDLLRPKAQTTICDGMPH